MKDESNISNCVDLTSVPGEINDPYKVINPYICGNIWEHYLRLEKAYTIARLRLEIFSKEFFNKDKE